MDLMKNIIIGTFALLALSGCASIQHDPMKECTNFISHSPEMPAYAGLGAVAGGLGLALLSDGDMDSALLGAGLGAGAGIAASGGLQTHYVCPYTMSTFEETIDYGK